MSLNKVMLIGNLGKDPEVRDVNGKSVCTFSMATSETWNDKEGQKQERTEWHRVVVWGPQAKPCGEYLAKGRQCYVEGSIRQRQYDDKDGNTKYITEIIAQRVQFLGGKPNEGGGSGSGGGQRTGGGGNQQRGGSNNPPPPDDDDIPF